MKKPKIETDVCGQPGGPSPEVQAMVDAEQAELIAEMRKQRAAQERVDQDELDRRVHEAKQAIKSRQALEQTVAELKKRVATLEGK